MKTKNNEKFLKYIKIILPTWVLIVCCLVLLSGLYATDKNILASLGLASYFGGILGFLNITFLIVFSKDKKNFRKKAYKSYGGAVLIFILGIVLVAVSGYQPDTVTIKKLEDIYNQTEIKEQNHNADELKNQTQSESVSTSEEKKYQNPDSDKNIQIEGELVSVTRVIDGDTIDTSIGRIRFIGLDTPETKDPRKPVQCFGQEASNKMRELVENKKVFLHQDETQGDRDKYQRLLRYVYLEDGRNVAFEMISGGYGHEYTYKNNPYKQQLKFKQAQSDAEQNQRGLWHPNTCNGQTNVLKSPNNSPSATPHPQTNTQAQNPNCLIKGNIGSSGKKIYHIPGQAFYNKTKINIAAGEKWFCSEAEALAAGWTKAKN